MPALVSDIMAGCTQLSSRLGAEIGEEIGKEHPEYVNAKPEKTK
jgi:hypothetical protein